MLERRDAAQRLAEILSPLLGGRKDEVRALSAVAILDDLREELGW
jgi:hypothetical protein